eukprot:UN02608
MCSYFYNLINPVALEQPGVVPLFRPQRVFNPITQKYESATETIDLAGDAKLLESLISQLREKYLVHRFNELNDNPNLPHGAKVILEKQKAIWDSFFKPNTVGRYGLPVILDELLQLVVDKAHDRFLTGQWNLDDAQYQHLPGVVHNYVDISQNSQHDQSKIYQAPSLHNSDGTLNLKAQVEIPTVLGDTDSLFSRHEQPRKENVSQFSVDFNKNDNSNNGDDDGPFVVPTHIPLKEQKETDHIFNRKSKEEENKSSGGFFGSWFK